MGKEDRFRGQYDPVAALRNAPKLMGMELERHGSGLQGGYYLNGDRHAFRKDKLKVFIGRGSVWVSEEGDRCISLQQWLVEFGGAADYREALKMINGESQAIVWNREVREKAVPKMRYVDPAALQGARQYDLGKCSLFRWMCTLFPEEKVREAWARYNVTTDSHWNAVFWYVDQDGRVLYDKRILYKEDGHRDKSFFPGRQYRVADGYSGRCFFGANVAGDGRKSFVVESEKTALLGYLYYGRRFLATGGKGNLRDIEPEMMLCPDMDARMEWEEKGEVFRWWEKWGVPSDRIPDHADIGDMVVEKMLNLNNSK